MAFLIIILVMGVFMIFMASRGNKQRQSQAAKMQSALVVGAEVRTIGGLVGEVVEVTDEHVFIQTTPEVRLKFVKTAVAGVVPPAEESESEDEAEQDGEYAAEADPDAGLDAAAEPSDQVPAASAEESDESAPAQQAESEPAKR